MASGESSKLLKEKIEGSNGSITNYGSSEEYLTASACSADYFTASYSSEVEDIDETRWLTQSSPAVLEPSSRSDGQPENLLKKLFLRSCPQPSTKEVAISSSGDSTGSSAEYLTASACSADYFTASYSSEAKDKNDTRGLTQFSPAVLEPSSSRSDGQPKNLLKKLFLRSWPQPSTKEFAISSSGDSSSYEDERNRSDEHRNINEQEVSISSSGDSRNREDEPLINRENRTNQQQTDEPHSNCLRNFMNCYLKCVRAIDNSCFIGIFQVSVFLVCISTIIMGIAFYRSCEGKYPSTNPLINIVMGIFGLFLSYKWVAKVCREDRGERFWDHDKNRLILFLVLVLFFMTLEFVFFSQMTPKNLQSQVEAKCPKMYYDYLYYMHMVNGGFVALASLLYLPDFCIYVYNYRRLVPSHLNGHYEPL